MIQHNIDLCDELIRQRPSDDEDIYTVANVQRLIDWVKTQFPANTNWQDVEMTGVPLSAFFDLVEDYQEADRLREENERLRESLRQVRRIHEPKMYYSAEDHMVFAIVDKALGALPAAEQRVQAAADELGRLRTALAYYTKPHWEFIPHPEDDEATMIQYDVLDGSYPWPWTVADAAMEGHDISAPAIADDIMARLAASRRPSEVEHPSNTGEEACPPTG